jgi:hypothetical protein
LNYILRFSVLLFLSSIGSSTSIIVKVEAKKITIAADTRAEDLFDNRVTNLIPHYRDDECKVGGRGAIVFAIAGNARYRKLWHGVYDPVDVWDGLQEADQSASHYQSDLIRASDEWGRQAMRHFLRFYNAAPARVRNLASENPMHLVASGIFAGWANGKATLISEDISLDESQKIRIVGTRRTAYEQALPYTQNSSSQELIDGISERGARAAVRWYLVAPTFPAKERDWRWLAFVLNVTAEREENVSPRTADVLTVTPNGNTWLQSDACRK